MLLRAELTVILTGGEEEDMGQDTANRDPELGSWLERDGALPAASIATPPA
jgi:hypothetical protein